MTTETRPGVEARPDDRAALEVRADEDGARLDVWLVARQPGIGRAEARRVIEGGHVRVNGRRAVKGARLSPGDRVELSRKPEPRDFDARPGPDVPLSIVYEDEALVVVDKQAGLPTHPLREDDRETIASGLVARYPEMAGVGYARREPGLVHRLDNDTSGLLLAARSAEAFEALKDALKAGRVEKHYLALVTGTLPLRPPIELPLEADPRDARRVRAAEHGGPGARAARTEILRAEPRGDDTLLLLSASVAVRHQLRAHLAAIGHPLVGDALYGGPTDRLARHFLHASSLTFAHPTTGAPLTFTAPLPKELAALVGEGI